MNELESEIGKLSSLIDRKLCTKAGCPDELAQLRRLLHLQIIEARALGVALPKTYSQRLIPLPNATCEVNIKLLQTGQMPFAASGRARLKSR